MDNDLLIAFAYLATPADGSVVDTALHLKSLMRERSLVKRVLNSVPIPATVTDVSFEESSNRLVVSYKPDVVREGFKEVEQIRTDRLDGANQEVVRAMWSNLVGIHVVIYKTDEETNNPKHPKVRIAPYVRVIY